VYRWKEFIDLIDDDSCPKVFRDFAFSCSLNFKKEISTKNFSGQVMADILIAFFFGADDAIEK
jgi:hypothetical protein